MKQVRTHYVPISRIARLIGFVLSSALPPLLGDEPAQPSAPAPATTTFLAGLDAQTSPSGIAFMTKKTRLWLGRSQVICFYSKATTDEDRYFTFEADENSLHVLMPPMLAPGSHLGYVRVRPTKEGHTQFKLAGASLDIDVVADSAASTLEATRPEIVTPVEGAAVWGKFVVGVERLNLSTAASPPAPVLRLPDGREIEAQAVPNQEPGPYLRYAFTIDAQSLAQGANALVAVLKDTAGHEIASDPLDVVRLDPNPAELMQGDCKDQLSTHWPVPKIPFAYASGEFQPLKPPKLVADDRKTFDQVVVGEENPAWALPVTVPEACLCQLIVTARGDIGGNALPTLGLFVDGAPNPNMTSRLATTDWQRIPVGHPVALSAGDHVLLVKFRNGFGSVPVDQRRLFLAKYELARLVPSAPALAANEAGGSMMQAPPPRRGDDADAFLCADDEQPGDGGWRGRQGGTAGLRTAGKFSCGFPGRTGGPSHC